MNKTLFALLVILSVSLSAYADDIEIVDVKLAYGGCFKRGLWQSIQINVATKNGFNGEMVARTDAEIRFVTNVDMPPNSTRKIVLPVIFFTSLPALDITAWLAKSYGDIPTAKYSYNSKFEEVGGEDILIGIEKGVTKEMPSNNYILRSKGKAFFYSFRSDDFLAIERYTTLESVDVVIASNEIIKTALVNKWEELGGVILSSMDEIALSGISVHRDVITSADNSIYELYKPDKWRGVNRSTAIFILIVYVLVIFTLFILSYTKVLPPIWLCGTVVFVSLVLCLILLLLPSEMKLSTSTVSYDSGRATFIKANKDGVFSFNFSELRKPVFYSSHSKERSAVIRIIENSCSIERVSMRKGEVLCFAY